MKMLWRIGAGFGVMVVMTLAWLWTYGIPGWWYGVIAWFEDPVEMQVIEAGVLPHMVSPRENLPASGPALWCVTTDAAWQRLRAQLGGVGPVVAHQDALCGWLNSAANNADTVAPPSTLFTFSGRATPESWESLAKGLAGTFGIVPGIRQPEPVADGWIMYAHLKVVAAFAIPYLDTPDDLEFTPEDGVPIRVRAFGTIPRSGTRLPEGLADQPIVWYDSISVPNRETFLDPSTRQCAINISGADAPVQIIVALMPRPASLHDGWAAVLAEARSHEPAPLRSSLAVPHVAFRSTGSLTPLLGLLTVPPGGGAITAADQVIEFQLDRTGVSLKAETMLKAVTAELPVPEYHFNRPFLLALKRRDADTPFFLAWITEKSGLAVRQR